MGLLFLLLLLFSVLSSVFILVNFIYFLVHGRQVTNRTIFRAVEIWTVVVMPFLFLFLFDFSLGNDCCSDSAVFSPEYRAGVYILLVAYTGAYIVSIFRTEVLPPVPELLLNVLLVMGLVLNLLLCVHLTTEEEGFFLWLLGNVPIVVLLLLKLTQHHRLLWDHIHEKEVVVKGFLGKMSWSVLTMEPMAKFPLLLLLCVPFVLLLSLVLMLFGQKPDALIRAFTDTYKHGFSQLDHECDNVQCGGHFLCSVGAKGHRSIVKPIRYGERNGTKIICNRQLLVSNAFEDLLQERMPGTHRLIRSGYNRVGSLIHRYYTVFNVKIVCDLVYIGMKPLEYLFLLILYTFDKTPENRIARQYLSREDGRRIRKAVK